MLGSAYEFDKPIDELEKLIAELKTEAKAAEALQQGIDLTQELAGLEERLLAMKKQIYSNLTPWDKTMLARHKDRPYTLDYVRLIFDEFFPLQGDRLGFDDSAIVGGLARLDGMPVVVIGQQKGRDLRERQRRNFGSPRAEGFRKALRLARLAARFRRPLISFVDTPAAAADLEAENRGISEAIARNLVEFAVLPTPIVVVIVGEGGSGGALGMAIGDKVLILEHSVYSVIPPEGCASILWRDKDRAAEAAGALNVSAQGALQAGAADEILQEPLGGAHRDPAAAAATVKAAIGVALAELTRTALPTVLANRMARLRNIGRWTELSQNADA